MAHDRDIITKIRRGGSASSLASLFLVLVSCTASSSPPPHPASSTPGSGYGRPPPPNGHRSGWAEGAAPRGYPPPPGRQSENYGQYREYDRREAGNGGNLGYNRGSTGYNSGSNDQATRPYRRSDEYGSREIEEERRRREYYGRPHPSSPTSSSSAGGPAKVPRPIDYPFNRQTPGGNAMPPPSSRSNDADNEDAEESLPPIEPSPTDENEQDLRSRRRGPDGGDVEDKEYYSPAEERDAVSKYIYSHKSRTVGRIKIGMAASVSGAAVGGFMGQSIFNSPVLPAATLAIMFLVLSPLNNAFGEFSQSIGLAAIFLLKRSTSVRRRYPAAPHVKSVLLRKPRQPFPPSENPWKYTPEEDEADFRMIPTLLAMAVVGALVGGTLPLVPRGFGGAVGAVGAAFLVTVKSNKGDLARCMGMRVVAAFQELLDINAEIGLVEKLMIVVGIIFDKFMILDRKHKIKEKLIAGGQWIYSKVSKTVTQVQADFEGKDMDEEEEEDGRRTDGGKRDER